MMIRRGICPYSPYPIDRQTNTTEQNSENVWFQASGSMNLTEPCHIYYWANWTTGDISSAVHDCETQNLTIVPDKILEIGGALLI